MGFRKPDLAQTYRDLRTVMGEISSPYNDGFTASHCKHDLYLLKCWLEDEYRRLPTFVGEDKWQQDRLIEILKQ